MAQKLTINSPGLKTDTAKTSGQVSVLITTTTVCQANKSRCEITIVNTDATNPVYLALNTTDGTTVPTATASNGIKLAAGASWTTDAYLGPIAAIAVGGTVVCTLAEI